MSGDASAFVNGLEQRARFLLALDSAASVSPWLVEPPEMSVPPSLPKLMHTRSSSVSIPWNLVRNVCHSLIRCLLSYRKSLLFYA